MRKNNDRIEDAPHTLDVRTLTSQPTYGSQVSSEGNISAVVHEQYCMCQPRTTLERRLVLVVAALVLLVVGLVVGLVLALVRHNPDIVDFNKLLAPARYRWFRA